MARETRQERAARQRAAYATYLETTTDEPKMSEGAFASVFGEQERAKTTTPAVPPSAPKAAPVAAPAPAVTRRTDRVWSGGDRDSDDIYMVQRS